MDRAEVGHGRGPSDRRQRALVHIAKGQEALAPNRAQDVPCRVVSLLDRGRGYAGDLIVAPLEAREIANDEGVRVVLQRGIGLDDDPTRPIERGAERSSEAGAGHAGGPENRARRDALAPDVHAFVVDARHALARADRDAESLELLTRFCRERGRIGRQDAVGALEQDDARLRRVDAAEIEREGMPGDFAEGPGELDARGAGTDHDERQPGVAPDRVFFTLGELERREDAAADSSASPMLLSPGAKGIHSS